MLPQICSEKPYTYENGTRANVRVFKAEQGLYLGRFESGSLPPKDGSTAADIAKGAVSRQTHWSDQPDHKIGSTVLVRYPRTSSTKMFAALVIDYKQVRRNPYTVQYTTGETEDIVPNRIEAVDEDNYYYGDVDRLPEEGISVKNYYESKANGKEGSPIPKSKVSKPRAAPTTQSVAKDFLHDLFQGVDSGGGKGGGGDFDAFAPLG